MASIRTRLQSGILWLILDHPPLNQLSSEMLEQLRTALSLALEQKLRLIVVTGAGEQAFATDLEPGVSSAQEIGEAERLLLECAEAFAALRARGIGTVALVKGMAQDAGCILAALCETILAHEQANFSLSEGCRERLSAALARVLPALLAVDSQLQQALSSGSLTAREALRLGLVHQVLSARRFLLDAEELLVMLATVSQARLSA